MTIREEITISDRHRFIELRRTRREESIVRVAPNPPLSRFDRTNQWVPGLLNMLVHVLVLGGIAAAHVSADQAHTQVGPAVAKVNAILAHVLVRFPDLDEMQVGTGILLDLAGESQFKEEFRYIETGGGFGYYILIRSNTILIGMNIQKFAYLTLNQPEGFSLYSTNNETQKKPSGFFNFSLGY